MASMKVIIAFIIAVVAAISWLAFLVLIFSASSKYRKYENEIIIVRDKNELNELFCHYAAMFEYHMDPDIKESYAKVEKIILYKVNPHKPEFKEMLSEEIVSIIYYFKL